MKLKKERLNNYFFVLIIIMVLVLIINLAVISFKIYDFNNKLSGHATSGTGLVNLTVITSLDISLTQANINFGSGAVTPGKYNATLHTKQGGDANVSDGNWSGTGVNAMVVANTGNVNCSLWVVAGKSAATLLGGTGGNRYQLNITEKDVGSCSGGAAKNAWANVNTTGTGTKYCTQMSPLTETNEIYIDVLLTVPNDGNTGALGDILTITAQAAG